MQRLRYVFSLRRRGRPAPIWRARPYRPVIDIRLADVQEGPPIDGGLPDDVTPSSPAMRREIWER